MTQSELDYAQHLHRVIVSTCSQRNNVMQSIRHELKTMYKNCDHVYPSGHCAISNGLCLICAQEEV